MPAGVSSPTILVIDDDEGLLHLIAGTLKARIDRGDGHFGAAGLEWLGRNRADLLLLDLKLHDVEGRNSSEHSLIRAAPFRSLSSPVRVANALPWT
jgi:DNA-binding response OmpR family regulator